MALGLLSFDLARWQHIPGWRPSVLEEEVEANLEKRAGDTIYNGGGVLGTSTKISLVVACTHASHGEEE